MNPNRLHFPTKQIGSTVWHYEQIESTNDVGLQLANDPNHHGYVFIADEQTRGRGQYGRVWQAPPKCSLLMSILLFPEEHLRQPVLLTALAAVAVKHTIDTLANRDATIKWPNDLLLHGKKICGILIESGSKPANRPHIVVGIGLNLNQSVEDFERLQLPHATSLYLETGNGYHSLKVAEALCVHFDRLYEAISNRKIDDFERDWQSGIGLLNREVRLHFHDDRIFLGILRELSFTNVVIETSLGEILTFPPESIRHLFGE